MPAGIALAAALFVDHSCLATLGAKLANLVDGGVYSRHGNLFDGSFWDDFFLLPMLLEEVLIQGFSDPIG